MAPVPRAHDRARETVEFSSLPTELRLMIWHETFEPRILHISGKMAIMRPERDPNGVIISQRRVHLPVLRLVRLRACEPPPTALQICRESRALALRHYIPSFQMERIPNKHSAIYFCPELDTVRVSDDDLYGLRYCADGTVGRIKALAVGSALLLAERPIAVVNLPWFGNLEMLIIVVKGELGENGEEFIRKHAEELMVQIQKESLQKIGKEWKLPAVKVVDSKALENNL